MRFESIKILSSVVPMKKTGQKILFWSFLLVFLSLSFSLIKQITNQVKASRNLAAKQAELNEIGRKNKQLRAKLEEIKSSVFFEEEAATVLGLSKGGQPIIIKEDTIEAKNVPNQLLESQIPIFRRWLNLFTH